MPLTRAAPRKGSAARIVAAQPRRRRTPTVPHGPAQARTAERRAIRATGLRLATTAHITVAAPIRRLPIIRTATVPTETAAIQLRARIAAPRVPTPRHARRVAATAAAVADSMAAVVEGPTVVVEAMVAAEATAVAAIAKVCI
jgi:hypothetical protein